MKIFSGRSNKKLAENIAKKLDIEFGAVELSRFTNNECRVWIKDQVPEKVILLQSFSNPVDHHIIEFCLMADALKRKGANELTAVIPWLGYSKQDKVFRSGEPLSVKVVAKIIQTTPIRKILTLDLHNPAIMGFFETPLENVKASSLFLEFFKKELNQKDYVIVSPDAGAVKTSTNFANSLDINVAYLNKKRDLETGKVSIVDIDRDISGKDALIIDDMVVTGSTLLESAKYLKEKGVKSVTVAATHHLFLDGVQEKIDSSEIDRIIITDSVQKPEKVNSSKLIVLSVGNLIASYLK
ncbi:ribose-phosphate diphosphokinase [Patescibacteria group bacterium]